MNGTAVPEPESSPAGSRTSPWRSRWSLRYLPNSGGLGVLAGVNIKDTQNGLRKSL